jgi:Allene oxide cyclase
MKRLLVLAVTSTAAVLVFLPVSAGARSGATVVHVVEHATTDTTTDTGKKGDSVGDVLTFANKVFDQADKHKVGTDNGMCIRTVAPGAYECWWTTFLARGQITVEGPFYDKKNSVLAITGGTGAYASSRGWMELKSKAGGTKYDFIFHLT